MYICICVYICSMQVHRCSWPTASMAAFWGFEAPKRLLQEFGEQLRHSGACQGSLQDRQSVSQKVQGPKFQVSGSKHLTLNGLGDQNP